MKAADQTAKHSDLIVHVAEHGTRSPKGVVRCEINKQVRFSTESMESYFFATWEAVAYDALLVAAAVEFADRTQRRTAYQWARAFELHVPVHDVAHWQSQPVSDALHDALSFLTGDRWRVSFYPRRHSEPPAQTRLFTLPEEIAAVIPFSNGLDSRIVADLTSRTLGDRLVRIRLGSASDDGEALVRERQAFTAVPYKVRKAGKPFVETSARSRGFKFALVSGIAAHLANANQVVVPESGQGSLGPSLVTAGQTYEDYRSHPLFTGRMERFLKAALGRELRYVFPRLWFTKGETLREFVDQGGDQSWASTRSCWQGSRQVGFNSKRYQCGVCAACMLRRMSIHAAGLTDDAEGYVWSDLSARAFERGALRSFRRDGKITGALREYAIAGALHLDHLSGLSDSPAHRSALDLAAFQLAGAAGMDIKDARGRLDRLLRQHATEWEGFMRSLGPDSFVADWAMRGRS